MKFYKRIAAVSTAILMLAVGVAYAGSSPSVEAKSVITTGDSITQTSPVDGSFFGAGNNVRISESVDGDVYAAGQSVTINGRINGDVLAAAQNVTIGGVVEGSVRVIAQNVVITGEIKGDLSAAGQIINIYPSASIARDASLASQSVSVDGKVGRDMNATVEKLFIAGSVGRDVTYSSAREIDLSSVDSIGGSVEWVPAPQKQGYMSSGGSGFGVWFATVLYITSAMLFGVILFSLIFRRWLLASDRLTQPMPWRAMLAGLVVAVAIPVVTIMLMLTFIGIPLAVFLLLAYAVLSAIGVAFVSHYIGRLILNDRGNLILRGGIGVVVYALLLSIPVLGFIVWIFGSLIGSGIVVLDIYQRLQVKPVVELAKAKKTTKPAKA